MVERVEHIGPDLQLQLLPEGEILCKAEVEIPEAWAANDARSRGAGRNRRSGGRNDGDELERSGIQVIQGALIVRQDRVSTLR